MEDNEYRKYVEGLEKEFKALEDKHLKQIKDRMPIEISGKVDSWPRCLTAVAQLKQERNNTDIENATLLSKLSVMQSVVDAAELVMDDLQIDKSQPAAMAVGSLRLLLEALQINKESV